MARPIRDELKYPVYELTRYINAQWAEIRKLDYPRQAAFAKEYSRGTVSLPPTLDDDDIAKCVGRFYWTQCNEIERKVADAYVKDGGYSRRQRVTASRLGISPGRFDRMRDRILERLRGFLCGAGHIT